MCLEKWFFLQKWLEKIFLCVRSALCSHSKIIEKKSVELSPECASPDKSEITATATSTVLSL